MSVLSRMLASHRIWELQWTASQTSLINTPSLCPPLGSAATLSMKHPSFGLRKFWALFYFFRFTSSLVDNLYNNNIHLI